LGSIDIDTKMKKIHRFLIPSLFKDQVFSIKEKDFVHQIKNVLKFSVGEEVVLFAPFSNDFKCKITDLEKDSASFEVLEEIEKIKIPKPITACISIVKKDNFELITQKLTELGVSTLIPIVSDRTIKQSLNMERLKKISVEALEQSGHSNKINILKPISLKESLEENKDKTCIYFDIEGKAMNANLDVDCFYIGPEGGWSDKDKNIFKKYNALPYQLGQSVLRAETASIVASDRLIWR
jgi:16S rRNA (uracil1498-N3)-methyltransferase